MKALWLVKRGTWEIRETLEPRHVLRDKRMHAPDRLPRRHLFGRADLLFPEMQALLALYEQGKIAPVIDCVLPLDLAAEGYARIASGQNVGKIVVVT
jgi:D-arabinose 1-dehydrogenase-like Zn-dependent alcohol dehydrogenase